MSAPAARPFAVGVDRIVEMDMNGLGILAVDRGRAGGVIRPFPANKDHAIPKSHFRMAELSVLVGHHHAALEAERLFQPIERSQRILVVRCSAIQKDMNPPAQSQSPAKSMERRVMGTPAMARSRNISRTPCADGPCAKTSRLPDQTLDIFAAGSSMNDLKCRHFRGNVIAVRWYCNYGISYRDLENMLCERGSMSTTRRFVAGCPASRQCASSRINCGRMELRNVRSCRR